MGSRAILGVARFHDVAAALYLDGVVAAVAEAERVLDQKHARGPQLLPPAVEAALRDAQVAVDQVEAVVVADTHGDAIECRSDYDVSNPARGWETLDKEVLEATHDPDLLLPLGVASRPDRLRLGALNIQGLPANTPVFGVCHHASHAASAIYMSGFDECAVLVVDGYGVCNGTIAYGYVDGLCKRMEDLRDAALLGWRYSLFGHLTKEIDSKVTDYLDLSGKVMGLNAYGYPEEKLVKGFETWFRQDYTSYTDVFDQEKIWFKDLLGERALGRGGGSVRDRWYLDVIASMQEAFSRIMCDLARRALSASGSRSLVMAGGCALNVLANSRVAGLPEVERFFVLPSAGDGGLPIGAAVIGGSRLCGTPLHHPDVSASQRRNPYVGVSLIDDLVEIPDSLDVIDAAADEPATVEAIVDLLRANKLVGIANGRAEIGPRALGHRSILASGIDPAMREVLNRVKRREWWRPFAPVCRSLDAPTYFEGPSFSEYMLTSVLVRPEYRTAFAAAAHEDGTARLQVIPERKSHPLLWDILTVFAEQTGIGVLINTSFNGRGKPLVNKASAAIGMVGAGGLDAAWVDGRLFVQRAGLQVLDKR
jgi:carbamoyltransferase